MLFYIYIFAQVTGLKKPPGILELLLIDTVAVGVRVLSITEEGASANNPTETYGSKYVKASRRE